MKKKNPKQIPQNIKKYRLMHNMTQEELAGKLYLDTQYYAQLERGERNFTIEKIIQICSIFHIGIENIIEIHVPQTEDTSSCRRKAQSDVCHLKSSCISACMLL